MDYLMGLAFQGTYWTYPGTTDQQLKAVGYRTLRLWSNLPLYSFENVHTKYPGTHTPVECMISYSHLNFEDPPWNISYKPLTSLCSCFCWPARWTSCWICTYPAYETLASTQIYRTRLSILKRFPGEVYYI